MAKGEEANQTNEKQPQYRPQNRDVFEVWTEMIINLSWNNIKNKH